MEARSMCGIDGSVVDECGAEGRNEVKVVG